MKIYNGILVLGALLLLAAAFYAIYSFPQIPSLLVSGLLCLFLAWAVGKSGNALNRISSAAFITVLFAAFLSTRLLWITQVPTRPFSDFAAYDFLANLLREGKPFELAWPYRTYAWGYPLVLAGWYNLVGNSLLAAKALNLLLGAAALLLVYWLARGLGETVGRIAAIFFCFWPAQAVYSSVLASEHLALVFGLGGLAGVSYFLQKSSLKDTQQVPWGILPLSGGLLLLAYLTRSALLTVMISALFVLWMQGLGLRFHLLYSGLLLAGFGLAYAVILMSIFQIYQIKLLPQGYTNLLTGSNIEYEGAWNQEDSLRYMSYPTIEEANQFAREEILRRIRSDPYGYVKMMVKKVLRLWGDETYAVNWSTEQLEPGAQAEIVNRLAEIVRAASQSYHIFLLIFALIGCLTMFVREKGNPLVALLLLSLLFGTALHTVFESQPRYHYTMECIVMVMAAFGISKVVLNRVNDRPQP